MEESLIQIAGAPSEDWELSSLCHCQEATLGLGIGWGPPEYPNRHLTQPATLGAHSACPGDVWGGVRQKEIKRTCRIRHTLQGTLVLHCGTKDRAEPRCPHFVCALPSFRRCRQLNRAHTSSVEMAPMWNNCGVEVGEEALGNFRRPPCPRGEKNECPHAVCCGSSCS